MVRGSRVRFPEVLEKVFLKKIVLPRGNKSRCRGVHESVRVFTSAFLNPSSTDLCDRLVFLGLKTLIKAERPFAWEVVHLCAIQWLLFTTIKKNIYEHQTLCGGHQ